MPDQRSPRPGSHGPRRRTSSVLLASAAAALVLTVAVFLTAQDADDPLGRTLRLVGSAALFVAAAAQLYLGVLLRRGPLRR